VTEVGKEAKTQSYKEYVQKMFGGGMTEPAMTEPAMKKNKMMGGGMMRTANPSGMATMASSAMRPNTQRPSLNPGLPRGKKGRGDI
jgi:hypothetical protein